MHPLCNAALTMSEQVRTKAEQSNSWSMLFEDKATKLKNSIKARDAPLLVWGVRPWIPTADHMGCALKGGLAHKTKSCGARLCSVPPARHRKDILKILRDLLGYVRSHDSCNLLLLSGYLLDLTDL